MSRRTCTAPRLARNGRRSTIICTSMWTEVLGDRSAAGTGTVMKGLDPKYLNISDEYVRISRADISTFCCVNVQWWRRSAFEPRNDEKRSYVY